MDEIILSEKNSKLKTAKTSLVPLLQFSCGNALIWPVEHQYFATAKLGNNCCPTTISPYFSTVVILNKSLGIFIRGFAKRTYQVIAETRG